MEKDRKNFSSWKQLFFWNVCFYRPLRSQINDPTICTTIMKKILWTVIVCSMTILMLEKMRNNRPKIFLHWIDSLFSQYMFSTISQVPKKCCYKFQCDCQKSFWTLINSFRPFVTLDDTRKNGPKSFVIVKTATFWNVCFHRPLKSQRNDLIMCSVFVKIRCRPLWIVLWRLSYSVTRETKVN